MSVQHSHIIGADATHARRLDIQRLKEIPPLPLAAQKIVHILGEPEVTVDQVVKAVEQDPALSARIVGMANSAFFGTSGIKTVHQAIVRALGMDLVNALALSAAMGEVFNAKRCKKFDAGLFWRCSTKTAVLASLIAPNIDPGHGAFDRRHVYLCGLTHGLGILALVHCYPEAMDRAFEQHAFAKSEGLATRLADLESDIVGADHYQAGGWLARKWGLPASVTHVIEHHASSYYHDTDWPLVQLVGHCSRWLGELDTVPDHPPPAALMNELGIPAERLARAQTRMADRHAELEDLARTLSG